MFKISNVKMRFKVIIFEFRKWVEVKNYLEFFIELYILNFINIF